MPFHSILFDDGSAANAETEMPECFRDLNLDQVIDAVTTGREDYDLQPFFFTPLGSVAAVTYRHEIFRDLHATPLLARVRSFAQRMKLMREHLAQAAKLRHRYQQQRWFLDATVVYCDAVRRLHADLSQAELASRGFQALRDHLTGFVASDGFRSLVEEGRQLRDDLDQVHYCVHIDGNLVRVSTYDGQLDYSAEVAQTFAKFQQGAVEDHRWKFNDWPDVNHVESQILDLVAGLNAGAFASLDAFCNRHRGYLHPTIASFDREVQFYVGYLEYLDVFEPEGLTFCYPQVSDRSKDVLAAETFDLALANQLVHERAQVVRNDFHLRGHERLLVVTGPNQGGKTTLARTFGQLHYLASIGCAVPGAKAKLFLFDQLFTHFEREEDLARLSGKLQDDLIRIHAILEQATPDSIVILNEIFTSTTLDDAVFLGTKILERLVDLDLLGVCVTFVDELASLADTIVSMVSTVDPHDPATRTYKVVRKPADGRAYAAALAEKYGLTFDCLKERIAS